MTTQLQDAAREAALAAPQAAPIVDQLDQYDAGLLNDFGGGNVEWWQDYIRAELGRAYEHYQSQMPVAAPLHQGPPLSSREDLTRKPCQGQLQANNGPTGLAETLAPPSHKETP